MNIITTVFPRISGTVLVNCDKILSRDQISANGFVPGGIIGGDNGWVYVWAVGSVYRNGTMHDNLQPGCRVSFEADGMAGRAYNVSHRVDDVDNKILVADDSR